MIKYSLVLLLGFCVVAVGCAPSSSTSEEHGHDHGNGHEHDHDHDHDHAENGSTDHHAEAHSHGIGPNGGTIVDWGGGEYHVELTIDHKSKQVSVFILGKDEKTPVPIDAESIDVAVKAPAMLLTLEPAPQPNDPKEKSSRYVANDERLGGVENFLGTITGLVEGTPYSGDFTEQAHGHEH